ncbi:hypothetical protein Dimus_009371 [Dionaea muscipula]
MDSYPYSYSPSAPPALDPFGSWGTRPGGVGGDIGSQGITSSSYSSSNYYPPPPPPPPAEYGSSYPPPFSYGDHHQQQQQQQQQQRLFFPPGTDPALIRTFQMMDEDQSGFIEDKELQRALSSPGYQQFNLRTIRLLIFLFKDPHDSSPRIGPREFGALWDCLHEWRAMFERFDRDRNGKIDAGELWDALHSLGYAVPPSVLQLLISCYDDGSGRKLVELNFDSFIECGMIIKGLTEKFKEKDPNYTGSATFPYDTFMSMVLTFKVTIES